MIVWRIWMVCNQQDSCVCNRFGKIIYFGLKLGKSLKNSSNPSGKMQVYPLLFVSKRRVTVSVS